MIWDPSDANPLHRRLPAEVTSRRHRPTEKRGPTAPKEEEQVTVDQKTAITLKPDARPKWLSKACKQTQEGKASSTELYNIVVSRRFSAGIPERIGKKLGVIVQKYLELFSDKQRRHLQSPDFHLNALGRDDLDEEEVEAKPEEVTDRSEAMLATCRDFVREQAESFESRQKESDEKEAAEADKAARMVEEATRRNAREAAQREERHRFNAFEVTAVAEQLAAKNKEAEKKRKLEEEADKLFEFAMAPQPPARESKHDGRDRSRSVSAARSSPSPPRRRQGSWRSSHPGELTGSRAILLNRDFQEDLPHLPRPVQGSRPASSVKLLAASGSAGSGMTALTDRADREPRERSRSRDKHRDRSRRRRR